MTLTPQVTTLIEGQDNFEVVRDFIAAILKVELSNQEQLASNGGKDPLDWRVRIFTERTLPFSEWLDPPAQGTLDAAPICNVTFDNYATDESASNVVERQKVDAVYHLDCYGYGVSEEHSSGHHVGDARAALEAHRCIRLVRKVLMSGHHTYLQLRGVVWKRMTRTVQMFQPVFNQTAIQHVQAGRISFGASFNEFSPQVQGQLLETITTTVKREETGEVLLNTSHDVSGA